MTHSSASGLPRRRITIAILALGGQGGGVLTAWITELGNRSGYRAQATSVPGVAQRTGSTVYYVEMIPWTEGDPEPVLSLTPMQGDLDVVIASELMEAGRAIVRGFVTRELTTLIASTHRVYAISEKAARGDGIASSEPVLSAAAQRAKRFIGLDMAAVAEATGCGISAVMFGALAGSGALPFAVEAYVDAIRSGGKAVDGNLSGFHAGRSGVKQVNDTATQTVEELPHPTTAQGRHLAARVFAELPSPAHRFALEGVRRLMDYQDPAYAAYYLDQLASVRAVDDGREHWAMTREAARYLALWMTYEDTIRVADLKIRGSRIQRVRNEMRVKADQVVGITEFMHPRFREICETLPHALGRRLLASPTAHRLFGRFFVKGRFVETTSLSGFLLLSLLASLRRWRRTTLRYAEEHNRIQAWLDLAITTAASDKPAALEIIRCQRLIKGYGDTFEHGLENFNRALAVYRSSAGTPRAAGLLREAREQALQSR
ncbi:MAG TPA: indolepyruvate oxidoreductase subunit beta family protein [Steroidobacteraceae bacterium]|nr:indolepyruvate oxidoreductase subunit beta family protein [Steroidobacteraceae bacterium]